jgi:hypothetical protein
MEFPPEILAIIREFSAPWFRYHRVYNRMLKLCAFREWKDLRKALQRNPVNVMPFLQAYETAQIEWLQLYKAYEVSGTKPTGYKQKLDMRTKTFRHLVHSIQLKMDPNE